MGLGGSGGGEGFDYQVLGSNVGAGLFIHASALQAVMDSVFLLLTGKIVDLHCEMQSCSRVHSESCKLRMSMCRM